MLVAMIQSGEMVIILIIIREEVEGTGCEGGMGREKGREGGREGERKEDH